MKKILHMIVGITGTLNFSMAMNEEIPLHNAVREGNTSTVARLFQDSSTNVNNQDDYGDTALHVAASQNRLPLDLDIVKTLLECPNIDVNLQNSIGNTALHVVVSQNRLDIVKLLVQYPNIDVNRQNLRGESAFHLAVDYNCLDTVRYLFQTFNVNKHLTTADGGTALHIAAKIDDHKMISFLTGQYGSFVNDQNLSGRTALHVAADHFNFRTKKNNLQAVKSLLLCELIDVNIQDQNGNTALHLACNQGQLDIAQVLVGHQQTNLDLKNMYNATARDILQSALNSNRYSQEFETKCQSIVDKIDQINQINRCALFSALPIGLFES